MVSVCLRGCILVGSQRPEHLAVRLGTWGMPKGCVLPLLVGGGFPQGIIPSCHHTRWFLTSIQHGQVFLPLKLPLPTA